MKAQVVKSPDNYLKYLHEYDRIVFLAGSIEMGQAENWQDKAARLLEDTPVVVLNPRRDDWDSSWKQTIDAPQFKQQVIWELEAMIRSDYIIMYFDPDTKSPVTMAEFGLYVKNPKLIVVCPEGFWRKGNIDIMCEYYGVTQVNTLEEAVEIIKKSV